MNTTENNFPQMGNPENSPQGENSPAGENSPFEGGQGDVQQADVEITYPTPPNADGYFYEDAASKQLEIETRIDAETELITKRVKLSRSRTAIMRQITGKEKKNAQKIAANKQDKILDAFIAVSTKIYGKDGKEIKFVAEDLDSYLAKDTTRLETACSQINF